jgi:hypothetical protein
MPMEEFVAAADLRVSVQDDVIGDHGTLADLDMGADGRIRADVNAGTETCRGRDQRGGMNALRQLHHLQQDLGLRHAMGSRADLALHAAELPAPVQDLDLELELVAGDDGPAELRVVDADDVDLHALRVLGLLQKPDAGRLREALHDQDAGHHRLAGEMALEELLGAGDVLYGDEAPGGIVLDDTVHEHERVLAGDLPDQPRDVDPADDVDCVHGVRVNETTSESTKRRHRGTETQRK